MKITIESKRMPSFTGFWTKWIAKCGKYKGEGRSAYEALREIKKILKQNKLNK